MTSRRHVLQGLSALLATACLPKEVDLGNLPTALNLGWRFIPGQRLIYTLTSVWSAGSDRQERVERWEFRVRQLVGQVAELETHLIELGGSIDPSETQRAVDVVMHMGTDGRLRGEAHSHCAVVSPAVDRCFGAHQAHRLLLLGLPLRRVQPGDRWEDHQQASALLPLLPAPLTPTAHSRCTVADVYRSQDGQPRVELRVSTEVTTATGPGLSSRGVATWDPGRGLLLRRTQVSRMLGGGPSPRPGQLDLELTLESAT